MWYQDLFSHCLVFSFIPLCCKDELHVMPVDQSPTNDNDVGICSYPFCGACFSSSFFYAQNHVLAKIQRKSFISVFGKSCSIKTLNLLQRNVAPTQSLRAKLLKLHLFYTPCPPPDSVPCPPPLQSGMGQTYPFTQTVNFFAQVGRFFQHVCCAICENCLPEKSLSFCNFCHLFERSGRIVCSLSEFFPRNAAFCKNCLFFLAHCFLWTEN